MNFVFVELNLVTNWNLFCARKFLMDFKWRRGFTFGLDGWGGDWHGLAVLPKNDCTDFVSGWSIIIILTDSFTELWSGQVNLHFVWYKLMFLCNSEDIANLVLGLLKLIIINNSGIIELNSPTNTNSLSFLAQSDQNKMNLIPMRHR